MSISPDVRNSMEQKLREQGWQGENYVLLHPGARWLFKCWEDGKNAALVQLLLNHGHNVVLTASPSPVEHDMIEAILGRLKIPESGKVWVLSGCLTLRELAAAIDRAKLFIGVDSVPCTSPPRSTNRKSPYSARLGWAYGILIRSMPK